jgi:hypothetical protein
MDEITRITHTAAGYTITTGWGAILAVTTNRTGALAALYHRGLTPQQAVAALNIAFQDGRATIAGLTT